VIGSGIGVPIQEVLDIAFSRLGLNYTNYVNVDSTLLRKSDPEIIVSDPNRLKSDLGWFPKVDIENLIYRCMESKLG
jgi:GDPmannose 4,6-dehydratase